MKIKQLEFQELNTNYWMAHTPLGIMYYISDLKDGTFGAFESRCDIMGTYPNTKEAMVACQEHFENKIKDCIENDIYTKSI